MFSNFFLRSFRILLLPFSILYWFAVWIRNALFDLKILNTFSFNLPLICVGNLSLGGTGKSPMVELLADRLKNEFRVAILSRGYKRKTRGYALASAESTAIEIGDEPMLFHLRFPAIPVAVGEKRLEAIPQLLHDRPDTQVIILDDAFQHRSILAGLNILLTEFDNLFVDDFYLPTGDLRDLKSGYKRAQVIVVTKCPAGLSGDQKLRVTSEIRPAKNQQVYFTSIQYGQPSHIMDKTGIVFGSDMEVLLVSGIANPRPLENLLEEYCGSYQKMQYPDHHIFTIDDLKEIRQKFSDMDSSSKIILTTEKDAVRLVKFGKELTGLPLYVIPMRHHFLFGEENKFMEEVTRFIKSYSTIN